jgi:Holliday junction resolvase-like predicted endonuclease
LNFALERDKLKAEAFEKNDGETKTMRNEKEPAEKSGVLRWFAEKADDVAWGAKEALKFVAPALWRRWFGRSFGQGATFEDFSDAPNRPTPNPKDKLGLDGERFAFEYVRDLPGARVIACNVDAVCCEIDLVYLDRKTRELVFVEVKTRRREHPDYPTLNAVDARRRKKLARASDVFAARIGEERRRRRFDVIVVIWPFFTERPTLTHHRGAFGYVDAVVGYRGCVSGRRGRKRRDR